MFGNARSRDDTRNDLSGGQRPRLRPLKRGFGLDLWGASDMFGTMENRRVRLRDIADELGLSVQAVSMAMRGHQRISEETRVRVRAVAERLGYRADPALTALAGYRTRRAMNASKWEVITVVSDWEEPGAWRKFPVYERLWHALREETRARGITLEERWLGRFGADADGVFRKLRAAGRHALLLAPACPDREPHPIRLPDGFQVVTLGPTSLYPEHHVVQWDHYHNVVLAWRALRALGRRRVGLCYLDIFGWRTGHAWLGAFLAEQERLADPAERVEPGVFPHDRDMERSFLAWAREQRPDAIITILTQARGWARKLRGDVLVAQLDTAEGDGPGINLDPGQAARTAVELLLVEMQKSLVSRQDLPFRVHIPGRWVAPA